MSDYCPLLEQVLIPLTVSLNAGIAELIEASGVIVSIVSSILESFSTQSSKKLVQSLRPKVYKCLEFSEQYRHACIEMAAIGAHENTITTIKEQLVDGNVIHLRAYVNKMREALQVCDICLIEFKSSFELTKLGIRDATATTQHKLTVAQTGKKDSTIAASIGGATMALGFFFGIPLTFVAPPVGVSMLLIGAAGTTTLVGGMVGLGVHGFNKKQEDEILVQIQALNESLNNSKQAADKLEVTMSTCLAAIDHIDHCRGSVERRQKIAASTKWQIEYFLNSILQELRQIHTLNSL